MSSLAVIVPTLDEAARLPRCLRAIARELPRAQVTVVDASEGDETRAVARAHGARVLQSRRGRGIQCAVGARASDSEALLFLHADAELQPGSGRAVRRALTDPTFEAGTLVLDYQRRELLYRLVSWSSRIDSYFTSFGDQGILVRRSVHEEAGGMPDFVLFEDVEYLRRLRRRTRVRKVPAVVRASTRRYERAGLTRQLTLNFLLLLAYRCGGDPTSLAGLYRATARGGAPSAEASAARGDRPPAPSR